MKHEDESGMNERAPDAAHEQSAATDTPAEAPDLETIAAELEQTKQQMAEYLDQFQRARAELANIRRRFEQDQERIRQRASERLILKLLPVVDDFGRATRAAPDDVVNHPWFEGVRLIERKLWQALESEGVAAMESVGQPFDPSQHEAVAVDDSAGAADTVVEEFQPGYFLAGAVLRPAIVKVGAATEQPACATATAESPVSTD
jgi:molecular chaperone GrpE